MHLEDIAFIRDLFIKRMDKEYFTPDTQKFADSKVEDYPEQIYNRFQQFKLFYFGRSKTHQDDIKVADDKVVLLGNASIIINWLWKCLNQSR